MDYAQKFRLYHRKRLWSYVANATAQSSRQAAIVIAKGRERAVAHVSIKAVVYSFQITHTYAAMVLLRDQESVPLCVHLF
jgi:hypothetical protein